jgi:septum formation protein
MGGGKKSSAADPRPTAAELVASETTRVWMNTLSEGDIRDYIVSGEPMDKAGAYAIQGRASRWIPRIEGCYFNVVGLPVPLVYRMLRERSIV